MPLFGKKKNEKAKMSQGGYPTQSGAGYPTQGQGQQPPAYAYGQPTAQQMYGYPQGQHMQHAGAPPPYTAQPQYHPQMKQGYYQQPQQQPVMYQGAYDAGARFNGGASANIPPPPPGVAPNAAQMAQMQGQSVVMTQNPGNFMTGGSDGGYVIW